MRTRTLAALALIAACFAPSAMAAQERSETHKTASAGTPFEIALVSNPSAGYGWRVDKKASAGLERLEVDDIGTSPPPQRKGKPLVGAPVIHTWLITPRSMGTARLVLVYERNFDKEREPPAKIHTFSIAIGR